MPKRMPPQLPQHLGDSTAQQETWLKRLREERVLLHKLVENSEHVIHGLALALHAALLQPENHCAGRSQLSIATPHLFESVPMESNVATLFKGVRG